MATRIVAALVGACVYAICLFCGTAAAADITGTVVIERKLTRRSVTVSASAYQRGVAVPLNSTLVEDPLAFERSHVVVYIDGAGLSSQHPLPHTVLEIQQ